MSYEKLMVVIRIMDRKHVNLLSTGHNCKLVSNFKETLSDQRDTVQNKNCTQVQ